MSDGPSRNRMKIRLLSEPFVFFYCLTRGIYFTALPQVLLSKSCSQRFNQSICNSLDNSLSKAQKDEVFSTAAVWNMILTISNVVMSLIFILPFGASSDIISKKKLMLIPPILRGLQTLIFILDIQLETSYLEILVVGVCLTSLYGDIHGVLSLGAAYMADETPDGPERTVRMIGLGACSYAGSGIGAFLSGILANQYGFTYSFLLCVSICAVNIAFVVFALPDKPSRQHGEVQHPSSAQEKSQDDRTTYVLETTKQTFVSIYHFTRKYCFSKDGTAISLLISSYFFAILCLNGEATIVTLFIKHDPLSMSPLAVGEYILLLMAIRGFGGFLLFLVINATKLPDAYVVCLGFFSFIGTYVAMALSTTQTMLFSFSSFSIGYPLTLSGLRSCLTKRVDISEHGTVLSFASFISLLGSIAMTFSINSLFKYTVSIFPGICIFFLAGCGILGLVLSIVVAGLDNCVCCGFHQYEALTNEKLNKKSVSNKEPCEKIPLLALHNRRINSSSP